MKEYDLSRGIWLVDRIDYIAIQELSSLNIHPLHQLAKLCVSMGMDYIELKPAEIMIRGVFQIGCIIHCEGFDIVPFMNGMPPDDILGVRLNLTTGKIEEATSPVMYDYSKNDKYDN